MIIKKVIVVDPRNDPRVQIDMKQAAQIAPEHRCGRCDGTGNELMFMYRRCSDCGGNGMKRDAPTS